MACFMASPFFVADISLTTKKISQRKAHVLPDLHFWLVEITQKWDDVRLEPGIRSGQRSTSPVFEGLGTKNNRSIGNIGPGMARL